MSEFESQSSFRRRVGRFFRRPGLIGVSLVLALVFALSGPDVERLGDRTQNALPLMALGCALAEGGATRLVGRFVLLELGIHVPKTLLGDAAINIRPDGGGRGFPSGHTAAAAFGATAMAQGCLAGNPAAQAVAILAAGFTGTSRVAAGRHTIWQVLAGAILGVFMNLIALTAFDALFARTLRRLGAFFGMGAAAALALVLLPAPQAQAARWTLDVYSGYQAVAPSRASGTDAAGPFDFRVAWQGRPFTPPLYYGFRAIRWSNPRFGMFLDYNHTKAYADDAALAASGFRELEFTHGLNNVTAGPVWRWPDAWGAISPYVGVGAGVVIPFVHVQPGPSAPRTYKYQEAGPSVSLMAGAEKPLRQGRSSVFAEYKVTWNNLDVDLEGGGDLGTRLVTQALNVGLRIKLGRE